MTLASYNTGGISRFILQLSIRTLFSGKNEWVNLFSSRMPFGSASDSRRGCIGGMKIRGRAQVVSQSVFALRYNVHLPMMKQLPRSSHHPDVNDCVSASNFPHYNPLPCMHRGGLLLGSLWPGPLITRLRTALPHLMG